VRTVPTLYLVGLALLTVSPAAAQKKLKKEEQWAACLWRAAPESSENWLKFTPTKDSTISDKNDQFFWLSMRLQGFCRQELTPTGKKWPIEFNAQKVWAALSSSRPTTPTLDRNKSDAWRCEVREGDVLLGVSVGFGELPTLRAGQPRLLSRCQTIAVDGRLVDA
jgi:hypothetical protein